jgi:hypothetical protein
MWWHLFERHRNPNLQHDNGRANSTRATSLSSAKQYRGHTVVCSYSGLKPDWTSIGWYLKSTTKADNCSWTWCNLLEGLGSYSCGIYQPPQCINCTGVVLLSSMSMKDIHDTDVCSSFHQIVYMYNIHWFGFVIIFGRLPTIVYPEKNIIAILLQ